MRSAENFGGGLDRADVHHATGHKFDPVERFPIPAQREFAFRAVSRVSVGLARQLGKRYGFEFNSGFEFVHSRNTGMIAKRILLRLEQRRSREAGAQSAKNAPPRCAGLLHLLDTSCNDGGCIL